MVPRKGLAPNKKQLSNINNLTLSFNIRFVPPKCASVDYILEGSQQRHSDAAGSVSSRPSFSGGASRTDAPNRFEVRRGHREYARAVVDARHAQIHHARTALDFEVREIVGRGILQRPRRIRGRRHERQRLCRRRLRIALAYAGTLSE